MVQESIGGLGMRQISPDLLAPFSSLDINDSVVAISIHNTHNDLVNL